KAEPLIVRRRRSGYITVAQTVSMAFLEERGGGAKDEIDMPADVAPLEVLPTALDKNSILPAEESAVAEHGEGSVDARRERLTLRTGGILEGDVLGREVVRIDHRGRRAERADGFAVESLEPGVQIEGQYGLCWVFADQMKEFLLVLDVDQFLVYARL